jgi:hypothetical protein
VADVVDRVVAGHVLLLQEVGGVALALGEDRDEHVRAGHLLASRRLHVDDGALDDALEPCGRLGILAGLADQIVEFVVDVVDETLTQRVEVDVAGPHDGGRVLIIQQRQQEMLQRGVFVMALVGDGERAVQGLF